MRSANSVIGITAFGLLWVCAYFVGKHVPAHGIDMLRQPVAIDMSMLLPPAVGTVWCVVYGLLTWGPVDE